jgi:DNA polymerase-1
MILVKTTKYKLVKKTTVKDFRENAFKFYEYYLVSESTSDFPIPVYFNYAYICSLRGNRQIYLWNVSKRIVYMLLLIDGDVLAYMACKERKSTKGGFDDEDASYSLKEDEDYLEESWKNFLKLLNDICETHWSPDYLMAVKSSFNFRNLLYSDYKMNRHKDMSKTNKFVTLIRKRAVEESLAIEAFNREADDFLRMWSHQATAAGDAYTVVSNDKDLFCIPGKHYNPKTGVTKTVGHFEAKKHFYEQLLKGDNVDNIPGIPGIGPKKAEAALFSCINENDMQEVVVDTYINYYEEKWYDMLLSNGKMLYLSKHYDDFFTISDWPVVAEILPFLVESLFKKPKEEKKEALNTPKITPRVPPKFSPPVVSNNVKPSIETAEVSVKKFKVPGK